MNQDHKHVFLPWEGECNKYICECGVTAFKNRQGVVVPHKVRQKKKERTVSLAGGLITKLPGSGNRRLGQRKGNT